MTKGELKEYGLRETQHTKMASNVSGEKVYEIIGFEGFLLSTWDFVRNMSLPENVWSISKATDDGVYNIHINQGMLEETKESAIWAAKILQLQIYLKTEIDDKVRGR